MFKTLLLFLTITSSAFASLADISVITHEGLTETKGASLLKLHLKDSAFISRHKTFAFEEAGRNYANGDFVILWGVGRGGKDENITMLEYKGLWRIMNYLSMKDFRVVMNVRSTEEDLKDALSSRTSSVVVWSSHGNEKAFYDFNGAPISYNVFRHRSPNVYQFILSACHGAIALKNHYNTPKDLKIFSWEGLTNPDELLNFLVSDSWTGFEGKKR